MLFSTLPASAILLKERWLFNPRHLVWLACFGSKIPFFTIQLNFQLKEKSTARFLGIKLWSGVALSGFIPKNEHPSELLPWIGAVSFQSAEGGHCPGLVRWVKAPLIGGLGVIPQRVMACAVGSGFGLWRWLRVGQSGCPHPIDLCAGSRAKKGRQKSKLALRVG